MRNKMNKVINWGLSSEMNDFCLKTGSGFETHLYPTPLVWAPGVGGGGEVQGEKHCISAISQNQEIMT